MTQYCFRFREIAVRIIKVIRLFSCGWCWVRAVCSRKREKFASWNRMTRWRFRMRGIAVCPTKVITLFSCIWFRSLCGINMRGECTVEAHETVLFPISRNRCADHKCGHVVIMWLGSCCLEQEGRKICAVKSHDTEVFSNVRNHCTSHKTDHAMLM